MDRAPILGLTAVLIASATVLGQQSGMSGPLAGMGGMSGGMISRPVPEGPLPNDPDQLVAAMAGWPLALMAGSRGQPSGFGWDAATRLREMKEAALPALARGLESTDRSIRLNSGFVLNGIGSSQALALRLHGAADPDPEIRALLVGALPAFWGDEAHRAVLRALGDADPAVRNAAIRALTLYPPQEVPADTRLDVANRLIPSLDDPANRRAAIEALGRLGMNVAALPLARLLKDHDLQVRRGAADALRLLKDPRVTPELAVTLRDPDSIVRHLAAWALGEIGDPRAVPALIEALDDATYYVRRDAATALGKIADRRAVVPLIPLLVDPDEHVRSAAFDALGQIRDPDAILPLVRVALDSTDDHVRSAACQALRRLGADDLDDKSRVGVARWWHQNRATFLRPIPGLK